MPGPVDRAIVAVPAAQVADALHQCEAKGVRGVVLFTGGFAELGEEGARLQADVTRVAGSGCWGPTAWAR